MFLFGFFAAIVVGANKLTMLARGIRAPLVADNPWFFIALAAMIIGTQLFLAGFIAELVSRSAPERNIYQIETRTGGEADGIVSSSLKGVSGQIPETEKQVTGNPGKIYQGNADKTLF